MDPADDHTSAGAARVVSGQRLIAAPAEAIFAILADPSRHHQIDGSGMVQHARRGATTLTLGATFGMDMKLGPIPYRITNTVVEFEPDRLIAWRHFGGHRWRYRLEPRGADTLVTEQFDWSTSRGPKLIEWMGYPARHVGSIERTLARLADALSAEPSR